MNVFRDSAVAVLWTGAACSILSGSLTGAVGGSLLILAGGAVNPPTRKTGFDLVKRLTKAARHEVGR